MGDAELSLNLLLIFLSTNVLQWIEQRTDEGNDNIVANPLIQYFNPRTFSIFSSILSFYNEQPPPSLKGSMDSTKGSEKAAEKDDIECQKIENGIVENFVTPRSLTGLLKRLATAGVEMRGLEPIPVEARTHTKYYNIFTLFGGSFLSILP